MPAPTTWIARAGTALGFVLMLLVGILYLGAGLIAPLPWVLGLWVIWVTLAAYAVRARHRPGVVLAVPVVAAVAWAAIVSLGEALFGWTA